jgi:hypothetical protein
MFGGADTTGATLMHGSFYILRSPKVYQKMKEELISIWPDLHSPPRWEELERLPYLVRRKLGLRLDEYADDDFRRLSLRNPSASAQASPRPSHASFQREEPSSPVHPSPEA